MFTAKAQVEIAFDAAPQTADFLGRGGIVRLRSDRPGRPPVRFSIASVELGAFLRRMRLATMRDGRPLSRAVLAEEINQRHRLADEPRISAAIIARTEAGGHRRGVGYLHLSQMVRGLDLVWELTGRTEKFRPR